MDISDIMHDVKRSGCLGKSKQLSKLLQYLLENSIEKGVAVTQIDLALDVFGRDESFDPINDSIVRVEMHRLRAQMAKFNAANNSYRIEIPVGSYAVEIVEVNRCVEEGLPLHEGMWIWLKSKRIPKVLAVCSLLAGLIIPLILYYNLHFNLVSVQGINASYEESQCSEKVPNVSIETFESKRSNVEYSKSLIASVLAQHSSVNLVEDSTACELGTPAFKIRIGTIESGDVKRMTFKTYHRTAPNIVDFANISISNDNHISSELFRNDLTRLAVDLAKPYGIIPRYASTIPWAVEGRRRAYSCVIVMYDSYNIEDESSYKDFLSCLEKAVKSGYGNIDVLGSLATTYIQQYVGYNPNSVSNPLSEAAALLDQVGPSWVNSSEVVIAKLIYESERPDFQPDQLRTAISVATSRYDSNPHVLLTAAIRSGYKLGDWDMAKELSDKVKLIHSESDSSVYLVDAAYALLFLPADRVMSNCKKVFSERSLISNILVSSCATKANDSFWKSKTATNLRRLQPSRDIPEFINGRNYENGLSRILIASTQ